MAKFFHIKNCYFSDENRKKRPFFGLGFFREYNFFRLDEYFSKSLSKKVNGQAEITLRNFEGLAMTQFAKELN